MGIVRFHALDTNAMAQWKKRNDDIELTGCLGADEHHCTQPGVNCSLCEEARRDTEKFPSRK